MLRPGSRRKPVGLGFDGPADVASARCSRNFASAWWLGARFQRERHPMMDIRENMEVVDANDQHVGIVEKVEGTRIKLSSHDMLDPRKPFLDMSQVSTVEGNKVKLRQKVSAVSTRAFLSSEG
ncbi:DUF2171 domain-containing protein [Labrys neptuniae]|uniref:DUF2171 domain-containing protein n=1 Tax=Labrys neptuniae TaxID=376174 RepID=UPI00288EF1BA|nr:DUF2171 domain-containing protein [Labrys neptuniae]MDT3379686.1 DUF2171 domain-containing protein [Labrys neptuniae]